MAIGSPFVPASRPLLAAAAERSGDPAKWPGERLDRRVLIDQSRRQISSQPLGELTGQADRLGRPESIAGEGLPDIDLVWLDSQPLGKFCDQPRLDGVRGVGAPGHGSRLAEILERPLQEARLASLAPDLAAGGHGNAPGPNEHDRPEPAHHVVRPLPAEWSEPRPRHPTVCGPCARTLVCASGGLPVPDWYHGSISATTISCSSSGPSTENAAQQAGRNRRVALFHSQFNIVGINLAATDDDQILQTAGNKQVFIVHESEIPGTQKRSLPGIFQVCAASAFGVLRSVPISLRDAWAGYPDFAHLIRFTNRHRLRMNDATLVSCHGAATAYKCSHILILVTGINDAILFKRFHPYRSEHMIS